MTWTPLRRRTAGLLAAAAIALAGGGLPVSNGTAAPVPTAPASGEDKPTLDRVKLGDVSGLLQQEGVRQEIGLSEADYKTLTDLRRHHLQNLDQMSLIGLSRSRLDQTKADFQADYQQKLLKMLAPAGAKRLRQAVLQAAGPRVLLHRLVIRELRLTAAQEDRLDDLLSVPTGEAIKNDQLDKAAEAHDAELAAALKVLTPEQRKRWDALVGEPLPTADLLRSHPKR